MMLRAKAENCRRKTINLAGMTLGEVEDWLRLQPKG